MQIIFVIGIYVFIYNFFIISNSEALKGESVRYAIENEFPYIVSIASKLPNTTGPYAPICTASLVSNRDVLSADHCVRDKRLEDVKIYVGNVNLEKSSPANIVWWLFYDHWAEKNGVIKTFSRNDMVMIRLERNITRRIQPGIISPLRIREFIDREVAIIGWGRKDNNTRTKFLQMGTVRVIDVYDCLTKIRKRYDKTFFLERNFFCTLYEPYVVVGHGDSGGPILYYNEIVGISRSVCPSPDEPKYQVNIHTGIHNYRNFIFDVIANVNNDNIVF